VRHRSARSPPMHTITHVTDRITLVMLNVAIWSGRKK
jgi:hypothetical protein